MAEVLVEDHESSPLDLKWLHKLEVIECEVNGEIMSYEVEDFGDYYDGTDEAVLADIEEFLDSHQSTNLDLKHFLLHDVLHPIEFTLRCGVRDIARDEQVNRLRRQKAIFIVNHVLPRVYHHPNFLELQDTISRAVTGLLVLIAELNSVHQPDMDDVDHLSAHFKTKDFLAGVALQIWSVCLYEQGIHLAENRTIPYLRQLAMMDILDSCWNYAGGWDKVLMLLEERHGNISRISSDTALHESTDILRRARNSMRCQVLEFGGLEPASGSANPSRHAPQMYQYFPKCSAYLCQELESPDKPHRLRCYSCHYYHWCSPACQEYSEEIAGHHDIFCERCPEDKATEIRVQMQDHLNIPVEWENEDEIKCHGCGLQKKLSKKMHRCSKCKAVHYCSKACQVWDWNSGNHRSKCEPPIFESTKASI